MVWIGSTTVGAGGAASIVFSSIPQTFTHLQIRAFARASFNNGGFNDSLYLYFNSSASNYGMRHALFGNGATATSVNSAATGYLPLNNVIADGGTVANVFGSVIVHILDYQNTNKNKTVRAIGGVDNNGTSNFGGVSLCSGTWLNTSAITQIDILTDAVFSQFTRIDLYGITTSQVTGA